MSELRRPVIQDVPTDANAEPAEGKLFVVMVVLVGSGCWMGVPEDQV